jgi:excinuclease ABC subunit A
LRRFVCVTGVSGSGKTTLVREVLLPALAARLKSEVQDIKASDPLASDQNGEDQDDASTLDTRHVALLEAWQHLDRIILVDQSILGKTPRSNPAVYIGAFDDIREFFAQTDLARQRGLNASAFSFNSSQGQCERCRGAGFEKIEMQFLSDIFIRCPSCEGRRYRPHILEVKVSLKSEVRGARDKVRSAKSEVRSAMDEVSRITHYASPSFSIADLLDATIEEAINFLSAFSESRPAQRAVQNLQLLAEVGLGYLKLGQPINTLSGGESQRLKLVRHLAEAFTGTETILSRSTEHATRNTKYATPLRPSPGRLRSSPLVPRPSTLFLFDEPTTGLHFDDVRVLLKVFQRLVDGGHSVLVIEHNLDVIKSADWIIDLGPGAGDQGGEIVAQGTPEAIAACERSHTGNALREILVPERAFACR